MSDFRTTLKPFAEQYASFERFVEDRLADMSDDELIRLARACDTVTGTNCWWAIYRAAPFVRLEARRRLQLRKARA